MNINQLQTILKTWQDKGHGNKRIDFHDTYSSCEGWTEGHENRGVDIDHLALSPDDTLRIFEEGAPGDDY